MVHTVRVNFFYQCSVRVTGGSRDEIYARQKSLGRQRVKSLEGAGYTIHMEETRNAHIIFTENLLGRRSLERCGYRCQNNNKMDM
jgi:hypothetical protein